MEQQVAIATGGASGIGKSTAQILAKRGVRVAISGRRETLGQRVVEEIRSEGGDAAFFAADKRFWIGVDKLGLTPAAVLGQSHLPATR